MGTTPEQESRPPIGDKEVQVFEYLPGKHTYRTTMECNDVPGAFADVLKRIAPLGINVVSISTTRMPNGKSAFISIFAEMKKPRSPREIQRKVRASSFADKVKVEEGDCLIVAKDPFPLMYTGHRAILFWQEHLSATLKAMRETFDTGGEVMLFEQGYATGKSGVATLQSVLGRDKILENANVLANVLTASGWGKVVSANVELSPFRARIQIEDNFECAGQKSLEPYSQFLRGFFVGSTEDLVGMPVRCTETKCIAAGGSCCEFELAAKE